jgi:hypothetical protein
VSRLAQSGSAVKVIIVRDTACTENPESGYRLCGPIPVIDAAQFLAGVEDL